MTKTEIILNCCLGGFGFSQEFKDFLILHKRELAFDDFDDLDDDDIETDFEDYDEIETRTAPSLIRLMREFGVEKCGDAHCKVCIFKIDKLLLPYISIRSYDGFESLEFKIEEYFNMACREATSSDEIVAWLKTFFAAKKAVLTTIHKDIPKNK